MPESELSKLGKGDKEAFLVKEAEDCRGRVSSRLLDGKLELSKMGAMALEKVLRPT